MKGCFDIRKVLGVNSATSCKAHKVIYYSCSELNIDGELITIIIIIAWFVKLYGTSKFAG